MKKIFLLFVAFVFFSFSNFAQTADELIAKHFVARGGLDKIKALQSLVMEGSMNQSGVDIVMKFTYVHNKATRVDYSAMGQSGYNILTTTEGWNFNPFAGNAAAEPMKADQVKDAQTSLDLHSAFLDYKAKGSTVEYMGKETLDGKDVFKLKLVHNNGKSVTYYLNSDYLIARTSSMTKGDNGEVEQVSEYGDFRKLPNGYTFPFSRKTGVNEIIFDKIEVNIPVDEAIFKPTN